MQQRIEPLEDYIKGLRDIVQRLLNSQGIIRDQWIWYLQGYVNATPTLNNIREGGEYTNCNKCCHPLDDKYCCTCDCHSSHPTETGSYKVDDDPKAYASGNGQVSTKGTVTETGSEKVLVKHRGEYDEEWQETEMTLPSPKHTEGWDKVEDMLQKAHEEGYKKGLLVKERGLEKAIKSTRVVYNDEKAAQEINEALDYLQAELLGDK